MIRQNILVVDDHKENLIAIEAILEAPSRQLVMASSGNEALQLALKHDFSLVLLDVQMPDMDGFEVAELMRQNRRTRTLPIIFVTAISKEQKYVFKGYECGAVDYLFKPLDKQVLEAKVNVFLDLDMQKRKLQQAVVQMKRLKDENERLLQALGEGILGTDAEGLISFCNDAAATLLACDRDALIGQPVQALLCQDTQRTPFDWSTSALLAGCREGRCWRNEASLYARRDGDLVALEMTATPINPPGEGFSGCVILFREQTGLDVSVQERQAREARRYPRKKVFREMVLFDRTTGGNVGRLLNISVDGFKLSSRKAIKEGQRLALSMVLPEQINGLNTLSFDARAIWCQPAGTGEDYQTGFQFLDMHDAGRGIIEALMEKI
ncbi:sensory box protein/response regulator [Alcanivorax sp. S71-1-4]|uniref:response regulator n=1 Tax=Alcanivorax sp. S71-1-4 TaxID=1177159 RepID=UPI001356EF2D|nr:response regulator [Alcanivorax sp. S71-1-4]KAF0810463.1 sensory box protein/response regulator [Alcanivorax sp. S71-1-4]